MCASENELSVKEIFKYMYSVVVYLFYVTPLCVTRFRHYID